ncbi:MAG: hypothetical protein DMF00_07620 [Verrucomicrobia bacterium]|nr:MAG: hypothetical protein DMF00_07620 [Verrucomicrobiota bacterium]
MNVAGTAVGIVSNLNKASPTLVRLDVEFEKRFALGRSIYARFNENSPLLWHVYNLHFARLSLVLTSTRASARRYSAGKAISRNLAASR